MVFVLLKSLTDHELRKDWVLSTRSSWLTLRLSEDKAEIYSTRTNRTLRYSSLRLLEAQSHTDKHLESCDTLDVTFQDSVKT